MSEQAAGQRYAKAIFELAVEQDAVAPVMASIDAFCEAWKLSAALRRMLANPAVVESERRRVLSEIASQSGLHSIASRGLLVLLQRRRLDALPAIQRRLHALDGERRSVARAVVVSARPLAESYATRLLERLEQELRCHMQIEYREDASLIAGVVVRVGERTYDGSVRGRLEQLERGLLSSL